jgi:hypothetical protein
VPAGLKNYFIFDNGKPQQTIKNQTPMQSTQAWQEAGR